MLRKASSFLRDDRGMETVEWAVLAAILVAGLIAMITLLGANVNTAFTAMKVATD